MFETPHDTIDLGHSRLSAWKVGEGPDLVLVHGWPLHSATYRGLLPRLAKDFTCHLIDLPGAGKSETDELARIDLREHPETIMAAIDHLGLSRYALLGHDSGAFVARMIAAKRPAQVTALVMGNTEVPTRLTLLFKTLIFLASNRVGRWLIGRALRSRAMRRTSLVFGGCFDDRSLIDGEFHELFVAPALLSRRAADEQMELVRNFDKSLLGLMRDAHAKIECPVQMIWGAKDPWFPLDGAREMMSEFKICDMDVIDRGKLFVHEEFPEVFAEHAARFLATHAARLHSAA